MPVQKQYIGGRFTPQDYRIVCDECEEVVTYTLQVQDFRCPIAIEEYAKMIESHQEERHGVQNGAQTLPINLRLRKKATIWEAI